jgi:uncharacterized protein YegJ (DUF2314 family)
MIRLLAIVIVIAAIVWALRRLLFGGARDPRAGLPIVLEPDDPLMLEAIEHARSSLDEFAGLMKQQPRAARVKFALTTDTGADEQLWARVLALAGSDIEVELETQPVSQHVPLPAVRRIALADLLDWQIERSDGRYAGGFTMRAMFRKGREQWGELPADLAAEERRYE